MPSLFIDLDAGAAYAQIRRITQFYGIDAYVLAQDYLEPSPGIHLIPIDEDRGAGHDWISGHIAPGDICVTGQGEFAVQCLLRRADAVDPAGSVWTRESLVGALAPAQPRVSLWRAAVHPVRLARQLEALIARARSAEAERAAAAFQNTRFARPSPTVQYRRLRTI